MVLVLAVNVIIPVFGQDNTQGVKVASATDEASGVQGQKGEFSEPSEPSEPSEVAQGEEVETEEETVTVKKEKRFLFLFPVELESEVKMDEEGNVVDEKRSFGTWLLSVFSF